MAHELTEKQHRVLTEMCETLLDDAVLLAEEYMEEEVEGIRDDYELLKHYRKVLEAYEYTKLVKCGHLGMKHEYGGTTTVVGSRA